jgi:hypothetical protein
MPARPSDIWKDLSVDRRTRVAAAFWRDDESPDIAVQQAEAAVMLARRLNFRPKSISTLPVERRARHLAQVNDVSDAIATRALIAYHFADQRPLMSAFLDAMGIAHESGLITDEQVAPPDARRVAQAIETIRSHVDPDDLRLYLRTLAALDSETWKALETVLPA